MCPVWIEKMRVYVVILRKMDLFSLSELEKNMEEMKLKINQKWKHNLMA